MAWSGSRVTAPWLKQNIFSETKYIFLHLLHDGGRGGGGVGHAEAVAEAPGGHGDRGQHLDRDTWARGHVDNTAHVIMQLNVDTHRGTRGDGGSVE